MDNRVLEKDIVIPALEEIKNNPNITTTDLIKRLKDRLKLYPKDLELLSGRSDDHFSQIVRNLCGSNSSTNTFGQCVTITKIDKVSSFVINQNGLDLLNGMYVEEIEDLIDDEKYQNEVFKSNVYSNKKDLDDSSNRDPVVTTDSSGRTTFVRDPKIAKTVLKEKNYICENAKYLHKQHFTFISVDGNRYQEAHHLIPMKAQKYFDINLDRPENIVSLCPICHKKIHLARKKDRIKILNNMYKIKKKQLHKVGIDITIEDLFNRYYS